MSCPLAQVRSGSPRLRHIKRHRAAPSNSLLPCLRLIIALQTGGVALTSTTPSLKSMAHVHLRSRPETVANCSRRYKCTRAADCCSRSKAYHSFHVRPQVPAARFSRGGDVLPELLWRGQPHAQGLPPRLHRRPRAGVQNPSKKVRIRSRCDDSHPFIFVSCVQLSCRETFFLPRESGAFS